MTDTELLDWLDRHDFEIRMNEYKYSKSRVLSWRSHNGQWRFLESQHDSSLRELLTRAKDFERSIMNVETAV